MAARDAQERVREDVTVVAQGVVFMVAEPIAWEAVQQPVVLWRDTNLYFF